MNCLSIRSSISCINAGSLMRSNRTPKHHIPQISKQAQGVFKPHHLISTLSPINTAPHQQLPSPAALTHFNTMLRQHYIPTSDSPKNGIEGGFRPEIAKLAAASDYNLSIGAPPWPVPAKVLQDFKDAFMNDPSLFSYAPMSIDQSALLESISVIADVDFKSPTAVIPTPTSKLTAGYVFRTLKHLGVTHVAIQVPWFTPSVVSALDMGLTIVPIYATNDDGVCNALSEFSSQYGDRGVFWHNPTNPVSRELSDFSAKRVVNDFQQTGTYLVGDCAYWDCGPLSGESKKGLLNTCFSSHHSKLNTLWLLSASKGAIRIAGARAGFALSQNEPLLNALSNTITRAQSFPSKLNTQLAINSLHYASSYTGLSSIQHDLVQCAIARDSLFDQLTQYGVSCGNKGVFLTVHLPRQKAHSCASSTSDTIAFRIPSFALTSKM